MTNAIEVTRLEMYQALAAIKACVAADSVPHAGAAVFETLLEDHLEQLRQVHEALHQTARERFESLRSLEKASEGLQFRINAQCGTIMDLQASLGAMTNERDDIQLRLHAIDHAYNVQQKATGVAGGELRALQDQIGHLTRTRDLAERLASYRLTQLNGTLQELSALRKCQGGTSGQDSAEVVAGGELAGNARSSLRSAVDKTQDIAREWIRDKIKAKSAMSRIVEVLGQDGLNEEVCGDVQRPKENTCTDGLLSTWKKFE